MKARAAYSITTKGRALLRGPAQWALTRHPRDLLALCDPQVTVEQARQFMPPESLQAALYSLLALELIAGPAVDAPGPSAWSMTSGAWRAPQRRESDTPTAG